VFFGTNDSEAKADEQRCRERRQKRFPLCKRGPNRPQGPAAAAAAGPRAVRKQQRSRACESNGQVQRARHGGRVRNPPDPPM
jgi:hypothetical protein